MPSAQIPTIAPLQSLAQPSNTLTSPKQAVQKPKQPKQPKAPSADKVSVPRANSGGSAKQQLKNAKKSMGSVLGGY